MENDRRFITPKEAISLLNEGKFIHTFRSTSSALIGADHKRDSLIKKIKANPDKLELGGAHCRNMKHGLILDDGSYLFIETNEEKLNAFDPINQQNK